MTKIMLYKILTVIYLAVQINSFVFSQTYKIAGTNHTKCYDAVKEIIDLLPGQPFYGQDGSYKNNLPSYKDNKDGSVTDNISGLMWQKNMGVKITCVEAIKKADTMRLGGYSDWRVPTIKELYSLIIFSGRVSGTVAINKFLDTVYFDQPLGNTAIGEREIDAQTWSSTQYAGLTMSGDSTVFGVNFIDGRIKGYPKYKPGSNNTNPNTMYFRMVRGNPLYGKNNFVDNNDGTITDKATGLMWQKTDDGVPRNWENALFYAENLTLANCTDWRLPSAKELQSIVDYSRCPQTTKSPAINPMFNTTSITDPNGKSGQYPYFWTGTTHLDGQNPYASAAYIAFGEAQGKINGILMDVHGAGAQRSDPKTGNQSDYPQYMGPQGDVRYVFNYVRCVRNINNATGMHGNPSLPVDFKLGQNYPNPFNPSTVIIYQIPTAGHVSIKVFDILGIEVATLVNEKIQPGSYSVYFNASNLPGGIYYSRLSANDNTEIRKMIYLK